MSRTFQFPQDAETLPARGALAPSGIPQALHQSLRCKVNFRLNPERTGGSWRNSNNFMKLRVYSAGCGVSSKGISCPLTGFRMDHARIFKGTRSSVAAPHPFEIPLLAFVARIPRTGFSPDAADARCEALYCKLPVCE